LILRSLVFCVFCGPIMVSNHGGYNANAEK